MSLIIESYGTSGLSLYAHIRDTTGRVWNGSAFETYNSANWSSYSISLSEQTSSGYYKGNFPAGIASGLYTFAVYAGSPATLGDPVFDKGEVDTNGSDQNYLGIIINKLPSGNISGFDPLTQNVNLNSSQVGVTIGTVNALGTTAVGQVNAEVVDALFADLISELSQGLPAATPTIATALMALYMTWRNSTTQSTTEMKVRNNAGSVICKATTTDSGSEFTKGQYQTGP
jgi:hypothetical protein